MDAVFYIMFFVIIAGWVHRYMRVKAVSGPEYFLLPGQDAVTGMQPLVSIFIPARNEEKNIRRCVESLLAQYYRNIEIIVADDRSTDKTGEIVAELAKHDKRVKLLRIESCPAGWSGKNHALFKAADHSQGQYFVFTDADTYHYPSCIGTALRYAMNHQVDMLSINPHLVTKSFWENVIMPIAGAALMIWYPLEKINNQSNHHSYANGQFILFKRDAYEQIGGHKSVKEELLEDLALAKKIKQTGRKLKVLWGPELYQTHMYSSLKDIWRGWVRIFSHGFEKSLFKVVMSMLIMGVFSIVPYLLMLYSLIKLPSTAVPVILMAVFYGFMLYIITYAYRVAKSNSWYATTHLLGCLMVFCILLHTGMTIILKRQIIWRGTSYPS